MSRYIHEIGADVSSFKVQYKSTAVFEIAVKTLAGTVAGSTDKELRNFFDKERQALEKMRDLQHAHLIQAIAIYARGNSERCFVFPWAPKGNLRQYWQADSSRNGPATKEVMSWALDQVKGIADGLCKLHATNTRHGDVKPENILIFDGNSKSGPCPFLVVADVGIAKYHAFETSMRKSQGLATTNRTGTVRYQPPEIDMYEPKQISLKYDSWSLGCVLLEFVIWLLQGSSGQKRFEEDRKQARASDRFWDRDTNHNNNPIPHAIVTRWITNLKSNLPEGSALWDLLEIVRLRLLVGPVELRAYIHDVLPELQGIDDSCLTNPSYLWNSAELSLTESRKYTVEVVNKFPVPISQRVCFTSMLRLGSKN